MIAAPDDLDAQIAAATARTEAARALFAAKDEAARRFVREALLAARDEIARMEREHETVMTRLRLDARAEADRIVADARRRAARTNEGGLG